MYRNDDPEPMEKSLKCPPGTWSCQALLAGAGPTDFPILNTSACWFPAKSSLALRLDEDESGGDGPPPSAAIYEQCLQPPLVFFARAPSGKVQSARPSIPENYLCDADDGGDPKYFYHATTTAVNAILNWDEKAQREVALSPRCARLSEALCSSRRATALFSLSATTLSGMRSSTGRCTSANVWWHVMPVSCCYA